jgi:HD-like signal output (HDOD) protein
MLDAVNGIESLPVLTRTYTAVNRLINENAETKEIATEIESDPGFAARVLSLANSAFNGVNTGSVKKAIVYMGLTVIKELLLSASVLEVAPARGPGFDRSVFWRHAAHSNRFVEQIFRDKLGKKMPDSFACAGLLHDVGTVFLLRHFSEPYREVVRRLSADKTLIASQLEREMIGVSHEELGGYLLDWWGLPFPMVEAAMHHHEPLAASDVNREIVCAVHVADGLAWRLLGHHHENGVDPWALSQLNLSPAECDEMVRHLSEGLPGQ